MKLLLFLVLTLAGLSGAAALVLGLTAVGIVCVLLAVIAFIALISGLPRRPSADRWNSGSHSGFASNDSSYDPSPSHRSVSSGDASDGSSDASDAGGGGDGGGGGGD